MNKSRSRNLLQKAPVVCVFAGLLGFAVWAACSQAPVEYKRALPGYEFSFPRDHAAHPEYRTEWWYYTGHLQGANAQEYGFQLTFFRMGVNPDSDRSNSEWSARDVYFAHFAVTDISTGRFAYFEKASRGGGLANAGASPSYFRVWIDDWVAEGLGEFHHIQANTDSISLNLIFEPVKPPVLQGDSGLSQKAEGAGNASLYYSMTRARVTGVLLVDGQPVQVTGQSWLDREFGTSQLGDKQEGWDWFSLQFESGEELMFYVLREAGGLRSPFSGGTFVLQNGESLRIALDEVELEVTDTWLSKKSGATYPAKWRMRIPRLDLDIEIQPALADQELITDRSTQITYWEGSVRAEGRVRNKPAQAKGYVELTGYAGKLILH